jgi:3-hydroxyacyl-CoA dehydrogenase/enoyl-CoA hydratase/3-hydroxybutyryl-CoA epimerase
MGPIELADTVGLDICLSVAEKLAPLVGGEVPALLRAKVEAGELGKKSQQGFYVWKQGRAQRARPGAPGTPLPQLASRMIDRLVAEAARCLSEGVVEDADQVDAGVIFGTGFAPFRGGPMRYLQSQEETDPHHDHKGHPAPA